jgi:transporter family-2 protein
VNFNFSINREKRCKLLNQDLQKIYFKLLKTTIMKTIWFLIVFVSGALLPFQTGLNTKLGKSIESPVYSSFICFVVGALTMLSYILFSKEPVSWGGAKSASIVSLLGGGIAGAIFITATIFALPRIGIGVTMGLVVAGQIIVAVVLDHFGILVSQPHPFNALRFLGIICIIAGVAIIQKF